MTYFEKFNFIQYNFTTRYDTSDQIAVITDLTTRIAIKLDQATLEAITDKYVVADRETPESISHKLYGTPLDHWTILYVNNITDLHSQWPLTTEQLNTFCDRVYGSEVNTTRHFEYQGIVVDELFGKEHYGANSLDEITNYQHEENLNELKRFIRVIKPQYLSGFKDSFQKELKK